MNVDPNVPIKTGIWEEKMLRGVAEIINKAEKLNASTILYDYGDKSKKSSEANPWLPNLK